MVTAAHTYNDLSIRMEALIGVIIIVACIAYVFGDVILAAEKIVRRHLFRKRD